MAVTKVNLCGIEMDNPIIPASGTFGYGREFAELYDINVLGSFSFKGTTLSPRAGNPLPRIAECDGGMLNAVGLQNPGVEKVISHELPWIRENFHKPVMANVSGFSIDEYNKLLNMVSQMVAMPNYKLTDLEELLAYVAADKKNNNGNIYCTLLHDVGEAMIDVAVSENEICDAFMQLCKK